MVLGILFDLPLIVNDANKSGFLANVKFEIIGKKHGVRTGKSDLLALETKSTRYNRSRQNPKGSLHLTQQGRSTEYVPFHKMLCDDGTNFLSFSVERSNNPGGSDVDLTGIPTLDLLLDLDSLRGETVPREVYKPSPLRPTRANLANASSHHQGSSQTTGTLFRGDTDDLEADVLY